MDSLLFCHLHRQWSNISTVDRERAKRWLINTKAKINNAKDGSSKDKANGKPPVIMPDFLPSITVPASTISKAAKQGGKGQKHSKKRKAENDGEEAVKKKKKRTVILEKPGPLNKKTKKLKDDVDRENSALQLSRVQFSEREDKLLFLSNVALHLMKNYQKVEYYKQYPWTHIRNILHEHFEESTTKTSESVSRRTRQMIRNPQTATNLKICLAECKQAKEFKNLDNRSEAFAETFKFVLKKLQHRYGKSYLIDTPRIDLPASLNDLGPDVTVAPVAEDIRYFKYGGSMNSAEPVVDRASLYQGVLRDLIQSALSTPDEQYDPRTSFNTFDQYNATDLEAVFVDMQRKGIINKKKMPKRDAKRPIPFASMAYHLSVTYKRRLAFSMLYSTFKEVCEFYQQLKTGSKHCWDGSVEKDENSLDEDEDKVLDLKADQCLGGHVACFLTLLCTEKLDVELDIPDKLFTFDPKFNDQSASSATEQGTSSTPGNTGPPKTTPRQQTVDRPSTSGMARTTSAATAGPSDRQSGNLASAASGSKESDIMDVDSDISDKVPEQTTSRQSAQRKKGPPATCRTNSDAESSEELSSRTEIHTDSSEKNASHQDKGATSETPAPAKESVTAKTMAPETAPRQPTARRMNIKSRAVTSESETGTAKKSSSASKKKSTVKRKAPGNTKKQAQENAKKPAKAKDKAPSENTTNPTESELDLSKAKAYRILLPSLTVRFKSSSIYGIYNEHIECESDPSTHKMPLKVFNREIGMSDKRIVLAKDASRTTIMRQSKCYERNDDTLTSRAFNCHDAMFVQPCGIRLRLIQHKASGKKVDLSERLGPVISPTTDISSTNVHKPTSTPQNICSEASCSNSLSSLLFESSTPDSKPSKLEFLSKLYNAEADISNHQLSIEEFVDVCKKQFGYNEDDVSLAKFLYSAVKETGSIGVAMHELMEMAEKKCCSELKLNVSVDDHCRLLKNFYLVSQVGIGNVKLVSTKDISPWCISITRQIPNLTGKEGESHQCQDLPEEKEDEPSKKKARFDIPTKDTGIQPMQYIPSKPKDKHNAEDSTAQAGASASSAPIPEENVTKSNEPMSVNVGESRENSEKVTKPTSSSSVEGAQAGEKMETSNKNSASVDTPGQTPAERKDTGYQKPTGKHYKKHIPCRPWIMFDGKYNTKLYKQFHQAVLMYIMENPGITRALLNEYFLEIMRPVALGDILEILLCTDCITQHTMYLNTPSLFSNSDPALMTDDDFSGEKEVYYLPTVDCITNLAFASS